MDKDDLEDLLGGGVDGSSIFDSYKKDHVCPSKSCASGYAPLQKWPLRIESTGCAALGRSKEWSDDDDKMVGEYRNAMGCCHARNACYQVCGSDKHACDAEFERCLERGCEELPDVERDEPLDGMYEDFAHIEEERRECNEQKAFLVLLVQMGGCGAYDAHQHLSCGCVEKKKLDEGREKLLRSFYEEYNPDGVGKVKGLVEKARGKKRSAFGKILVGLVNKYPDAVKRKESKRKGSQTAEAYEKNPYRRDGGDPTKEDL
mmetsp:Transcript_50610/g.107808  ORF Transcript_50610/g.107808 Transcript_50610/m.107808 type:complete len:260 (-) Transcript_50610:44-823(-)